MVDKKVKKASRSFKATRVAADTLTDIKVKYPKVDKDGEIVKKGDEIVYLSKDFKNIIDAKRFAKANNGSVDIPSFIKATKVYDAAVAVTYTIEEEAEAAVVDDGKTGKADKK